MAEDLDVVVQPADEPQPDGRNQHQLNVYVVELPEEEHRNQNGHKDDHTAHRRGSLFLELSLKPQIADLLADLLAPQKVDDLPTEDDDDQQREDDGRRGPERDILKHTRTGQIVGFVQIPEKMIKHVESND